MKVNETNFLRHVRKRMNAFLTETAKEHGVKLQDSDIDMMLRHITTIAERRFQSNEQESA